MLHFPLAPDIFRPRTAVSPGTAEFPYAGGGAVSCKFCRQALGKLCTHLPDLPAEDSDRRGEVEIRSHDCERRARDNCYRTLQRRSRMRRDGEDNDDNERCAADTRGCADGIPRERVQMWLKPGEASARFGSRGLQIVIIRTLLRKRRT